MNLRRFANKTSCERQPRARGPFCGRAESIAVLDLCYPKAPAGSGPAIEAAMRRMGERSEGPVSPQLGQFLREGCQPEQINQVEEWSHLKLLHARKIGVGVDINSASRG